MKNSFLKGLATKFRKNMVQTDSKSLRKEIETLKKENSELKHQIDKEDVMIHELTKELNSIMNELGIDSRIVRIEEILDSKWINVKRKK